MAAGITLALVVPAWAGAPTTLTNQTFLDQLNRPVFAGHAPGVSDRLFVVEKRGVIRVFDLNTSTYLADPFLDIDALVVNPVNGNDERGLLGLAFHPNYANNGFFYVNYIDNSGGVGDTVVARYQVSANPDEADPGTAEILLTLNQPDSNHNGGWMDFGPDGYLYIASGDGGGAGDPLRNAQALTNLFGKMLRIDVDAGSPFAIPASNPFAGGDAADDAIWSYGLRNPWRNSFDSFTGDLWIADVGQTTYEEINFQPADSTGGENYGWDCREGMHDFQFVVACESETFVEPVFEYTHNEGCSITGGYVYRGCAIPDARGRYFFSDFCSGSVRSGRLVGGVLTDLRSHFTATAMTSFGEGPDGELYVTTGIGVTSGRLHRIVASGPVAPAAPHDYNGDGIGNLADFDFFDGCMGGPGVPYTHCFCDAFDRDTDGDVDALDAAALQRELN
jgi:glucose/arabinose dehydrogenase